MSRRSAYRSDPGSYVQSRVAAQAERPTRFRTTRVRSDHLPQGPTRFLIASSQLADVPTPEHHASGRTSVMQHIDHGNKPGLDIREHRQDPFGVQSSRALPWVRSPQWHRHPIPFAHLARRRLRVRPNAAPSQSGSRVARRRGSARPASTQHLPLNVRRPA